MSAILRCYEVTAMTEHDGIIEYLDGFLSIHELKKHLQAQGFSSLDVGALPPLSRRSTSSAPSKASRALCSASAAT